MCKDIKACDFLGWNVSILRYKGRKRERQSVCTYIRDAGRGCFKEITACNFSSWDIIVLKLRENERMCVDTERECVYIHTRDAGRGCGGA